MKDGDISNEVLPTILFHYSTLFDESGVGFFKTIKLKKELPGIFKSFLNKSQEVSTAIVVPIKYMALVRKLTMEMPLKSPYSYVTTEDLKELADENWRAIACYYDNDPQRGQLFQNRWYNV